MNNAGDVGCAVRKSHGIATDVGGGYRGGPTTKGPGTIRPDVWERGTDEAGKQTVFAGHTVGGSGPPPNGSVVRDDCKVLSTSAYTQSRVSQLVLAKRSPQLLTKTLQGTAGPAACAELAERAARDLLAAGYCS